MVELLEFSYRQSFNMRRNLEAAWIVGMFFDFCNSLKHSFSSLMFSETVILELKFHLVMEPRRILFETKSTTDRRFGDNEKDVDIVTW
jgi:hypothetical protein